MASNWGFEENYSFNGPIWSVSIEIIVYFLFFFLIKKFYNSLLIPILTILFCALIKIFTNTTYLLLDCLIYFFAGGLSYFCNEIVKKYEIVNEYKKKLKICYFFILLIIPLLCLFFKLYNLKYFFFLFFLFYTPNLLNFLSNLSMNNQRLNKFVTVLGNTTYSSYLLHFPIQIGIVNVATFLKINLPLYNSFFFLFYLSLTIIFSIFVYKYFEFPLMKLLRKIYK
jgi:peptidoglycan/LPS O-acetylase OafA/YrhL